MKSNFIARKEDEAYLDTVARAITSPMTTSTYQDAPGTDYHRLDVSEVLSIAVTENTPLVHRLARAEGARARLHEWLEQYLPQNPTVAFISETTDPSSQLAQVPTRYSNYMGKQGRLFQMSDEAQIIARANGLIAVGPDELARQMSMQLTQLVRDTERALLEGQLDDGSISGIRQFRGILGGYNLGTPVLNGWIGGVITSTTLDLGNIQLTAANVEGYLNQFMLQLYNLQQGPLPNVMYVPPRMLKIIKDAASTKVQVFMTQDDLNRKAVMNLGGKVGIYYTDFGFVDIIAHPLLHAAVSSTDPTNPPGTSRLLFLYEPGLRMVDYVGWGGFHIEPRAKTGPTETRLISQLYTLEARMLASHGCIKNFWA